MIPLRVPAILVAAVLLLAACSDDDSGDADGSGTSSTVEGGGQGSSGDGNTSDTGSIGDEDGAETDDTDPAPATGESGAVDIITPGGCRVAEVARSRPYAVTGIPADDPDGGLNVRAEAGEGDPVATLPEGTVVAAEECRAIDDGGVWWLIEADPEIFGWVNSSFLSDGLPSSARSEGGEDTERLVTTMLDALAAGEWATASEALGLDRYPSGLAQLDDGSDPAAQLEAYCDSLVCDAPYEVVAVRGTAFPGRFAPEVDVRFSYPDGSVIETFDGLTGDGTVDHLNALPGRSALAYREAPGPASGLTSDPADDGLIESAEEVRRALLSDVGPGLPAAVVPAEGVTVSSNAFVDPDESVRQRVTAADLDGNGDQERIWGYTDGVGAPIVDTVDGWMSRYRTDLALLDPDEVGVDRRVGSGNTIANLSEVFPEAHTVEFHRRGRGELADFNWSSVRLAFEQRDGRWVLVAITSDTWTI